MTDKTNGLYKKFEVKKLANPTKQVDCIVLEFDDPIARVAIRAWADECEKQGFYQLAFDTRQRLSDTLDPAASLYANKIKYRPASNNLPNAPKENK